MMNPTFVNRPTHDGQLSLNLNLVTAIRWRRDDDRMRAAVYFAGECDHETVTGEAAEILSTAVTALERQTETQVNALLPAGLKLYADGCDCDDQDGEDLDAIQAGYLFDGPPADDEATVLSFERRA